MSCQLMKTNALLLTMVTIVFHSCYLSPYDKNSEKKCRVKTEMFMYMEKVIKRKTEIFRKLTPYRISLPCHFMKR